VAALFLLAELVAAQRGDAGGRLEPAGPVAQPALLGMMLLLAGASITGLPPLPGFIGKLMILQAADGPAAPWLWAVVLGVGFLTLVGLARAGSLLFWSVRPGSPDGKAGSSPQLLVPTLSLLGLVIAMAMGAAPLKRYTDAAARQLVDRDAYARAVLGPAPPGGTVRPYPAGDAR
jgi:multicomponent K+:H+ antiporter subunit D